MNTQLIHKAADYVKALLDEGLTDDHKYHTISHTLAVQTACLELGREMHLPEEELEILSLAALFHDTGFVETYIGHEAVSHRIAKDFLSREGYPQERLRQVLECIDVTFTPNRPTNTLEKIIRDADLINLGSDGYSTHLEGLRHEWKVFLDQEYNDLDWYKLNYQFLKDRVFFTSAAQELYGAKLQDNQKQLRKMFKQAKEQRKQGDTNHITGNRSAQMMFKTALRNHLDLSTLADNKANMMLSVNALIITLMVPLAVPRIADNQYLMAPLLLLLLTCLASMISATLATRPIKMTGLTSEEMIRSGRSNLFFFGNFYRMDFDQYKQGVKTVLLNEEDLEDSIMRDLFFLGKSLGKKYRLLRICYTIFMIGVSLTVLAALATYYLR